MIFYKRLLLKLINLFGFSAERFGPDILMINNKATQFERATSLKPRLIDQHLSALFNLYRVNCVLDVGAHEGEYALSLRGLGYTGHIISFEPVSDTFERLQNQALSDERWSVFQYALGENDHSAQIQVTQSANFSSMLAPNSTGDNMFGESMHVCRVEQVEVKRLDSIFDKLCESIDLPRVYLKMDTQGYDIQVFEGLGRFAKNLVGIQSELSVIQIYHEMTDMIDAIALYKSHGFEISGLFPVSHHNQTMRVVEYDCVMIRADSL